MSKASDTPPPIRRWFWTKRGVAVLCLLLFAALVTRLVVGGGAAASFDAAIRDVADAGHPTSVEDYRFEDVPDDDNATVLMEQARAALPRINGQLITDTDWYYEGGGWDLPDNEYQDPVLDDREYLEQFGPTLELLQQMARATRAFRRGEDELPDYLGGPMGGYHYLGSSRNFARALDDAVYRAAGLGDHALALRITRLMVEMQRAFDTQAPGLIDALVAQSIRGVGLDSAQRISHRSTEQALSPEARVEAELLIAALLDTDRLASIFRRAMVRELCLHIELTQRIGDGRVDFTMLGVGDPWDAAMKNSVGRWLAIPLYNADAARSVREVREEFSSMLVSESYAKLVDALGHDPYNDDAFEQSAGSEAVSYLENVLTRPISSAGWTPHLSAGILYQGLAQSRMAAVGLAIWLYEVDHGERPETLDALVPDYLDAIPEDPYLGEGSRIGYRPEGVAGVPDSIRYGDGYIYRYNDSDEDNEDVQKILSQVRKLPLLYCVGFDLTDHDGSYQINLDGTFEYGYGRSEYDEPETDHVWLLVPEPEPYLDLGYTDEYSPY